MSESNRCQRCGALLPKPEVLGGRCPRCMLERCFEPPNGSEEDSEAAAGPAVEKDPANTVIPTVIGRYRILRLIGEGGMGAVYEAEQGQPRRTVALKIIKPGLASPDLVRRFEQESQALGRLQHPGIAQIYEAGTVDTGFGPQPYFAMEFIQGRSPRDYAETNHLSTGERLEIMVRICEAVHHAHQRGLIHRDLKPGNILVDETGQPKVLDFGVARVTDSDARGTRQTDAGQLIGTLAYMSPEQVLADPLDIDTRSDVYALGLILYELLAGRLPYTISKNLHETIQAIREEDPAKLSTVNRTYRGDIETIVAKALEKDRTRRYGSAAGMAADIRRYLTHEPIVARPPSTAYQLQKFARRHRALVAGVAAVFVVLIAGMAISTRQAMRASRAETAALQDRDRAAEAERTAKNDRDKARSAEQSANDARAQAIQLGEQARNERYNAVTQTERANSEAEIARAVLDFLGNDLLRLADPVNRTQSSQSGQPPAPSNPDITVKELLDRASGKIAGKFDKKPLVEVAIRETIAETYFGIGLYGEASEHFKKAIELRSREKGPNNLDTLKTMMRLAETYSALRRWPESVTLIKEVIERGRLGPGEDNPATRSAIILLVSNYSNPRYTRDPNGIARQQRPLIEEFLNTVIAYDRQKLGDDNPTTTLAVSALLALYRNEQPPRYAVIEAFLKQLYADQRAKLGAGTNITRSTMTQLMNLYMTQNPPRWTEAEGLLKSSIDDLGRKPARANFAMLNDTNQLASLYLKQGKLTEAESLLVRIVNDSAVNSLLGAGRNPSIERPPVLESMNLLSQVYSKEGKAQQADALSKKIRDVLEVALKSPPNSTTGSKSTDPPLTTMLTLALNYATQGRDADADELVQSVLEGYRKVARTDPNARTVSDMLLTMANVAYFSRGRNDKAEQLVKTVLDIQQSELGNGDSATMDTLSDLASLYAGQRRFEDAQDAYGRLIAIQAQAYGPIHPTTLRAMNRRWVLHATEYRFYKTQGQKEKAQQAARNSIPFITEFLELRRNSSGPDATQDVGLLTMSLTTVNVVLGNYAEAEDLWSQSLARRRAAGNPPPPDSIAFLGWLQFVQGKYSTAEITFRDVCGRIRFPAVRVNCQGLLGATLAAQKRFDEAEPLLLEQPQTQEGRIKPGLPPAISLEDVLDLMYEKEPGERILILYKEWGKPEKVAEWRQKLLTAGTAATTPPTQAR